MADIMSVPVALRNLTRFIPLRPGTKQPAIVRATYDAGQPWSEDVERWLQSGEGQRIGIFMGGQLVTLDADVRYEWEDTGDGASAYVLTHDGKDDIARIIAQAGVELPRTVKVKTQGGGTHWYFLQNPDCPVQQKKIGFLDVKAAMNGYCAMGAGYELLDDGGGQIAVLPVEIARVIASPPQGILEAAAWNGHREGTYGNKQTAFNNALTAIKGYIVQQGWSEDQANAAVRTVNDVSEDPMPLERLESTVLKNKGWVQGELISDDILGWALSQLGIGSDHPDVGKIDFNTIKRLWTTKRWNEQLQVKEAFAELERLEVMSGADAADETPVPWQLPGILPRTGTGAIIGGRGSFKTTLMLIMGAAIQRGTMCLNQIATQGNVVFAAGEAWEYTSRMIPKIPGAEEVTFTKGRFGLTVDTAPRFCEKLMDFMKESPSLIVIDTLSRFHVGDENKASDMLRVWDGADYIARKLDTLVFVIAHSGHQGEHVRGSSSWGQAFNTEIFTDGSVLKFNKQRGIAVPQDINLLYTFTDMQISVEEGIDLASKARALHRAQQQICRELDKIPGCSTEQAYEVIMKIMKCSRTDAASTLRELENESMIDRIPGSGRKPAQIMVVPGN